MYPPKLEYRRIPKKYLPEGAVRMTNSWGFWLNEVLLPPYAVHGGCWKYRRCRAWNCPGYCVLGMEKCIKHTKVSGKVAKKIYYWWAKCIVEAANYKLEWMLNELESGRRLGAVGVVTLSPRIHALLDEVMRASDFLEKEEMPRYNRRAHGVETLELRGSIFQLGLDTMDFYMDKMWDYRKDIDEVWDYMEELIHWACVYVIVYER